MLTDNAGKVAVNKVFKKKIIFLNASQHIGNCQAENVIKVFLKFFKYVAS